MGSHRASSLATYLEQGPTMHAWKPLRCCSKRASHSKLTGLSIVGQPSLCRSAHVSGPAVGRDQCVTSTPGWRLPIFHHRQRGIRSEPRRSVVVDRKSALQLDVQHLAACAHEKKTCNSDRVGGQESIAGILCQLPLNIHGPSANRGSREPTRRAGRATEPLSRLQRSEGAHHLRREATTEMPPIPDLTIVSGQGRHERAPVLRNAMDGVRSLPNALTCRSFR